MGSGVPDPSTGWVPVEVRSPRQRLLNAIFTLSPAVGLFLLAFNLAPILFPESSPWLRILVGVAAMVVAFALAIVNVALHNPTPTGNIEKGLLRVGTRTLPLSAIDTAALVVVQPTRTSRSVGIRFGQDKGVKTTVSLRVGERRSLNETETERLVALLELTSIRMPADPYDPKGKFARYNFPTNVERDAAIELVRHPPAPASGLPIPENGRYPRG